MERKFQIQRFSIFLYVVLMGKAGSIRSAKFSEKHDPKVIMYRIKSQQKASALKFVDPARQHSMVDENLAEWLSETPLAFGERGTLFDFVREIVWKWGILTDIDKAALHVEWIAKGLPENLWLKIEPKYLEIIGFHLTHNSQNIIVTFEADVFPYPKENVNPIEDDYIVQYEVLPLPIEDYVQPYWRQKTVKYGSCDYITDWCKRGMDIIPTVLTSIETVEPLIYDKTVSIFAFLTEPYQSPLDKAPILATTFEAESGEDKGKSKEIGVLTSESSVTLASPSVSPNINITYETEVT